MDETTVGEVQEEERYRDRESLEAELQEIARSKAAEPEPPRGFWSKRRRKR
jgi:hypothetical protein